MQRQTSAAIIALATAGGGSAPLVLRALILTCAASMSRANAAASSASAISGATNIAELGIGLNPAARISDEITETKKRLGTAHFALGDNAGGYGGVVESPLHLDGMLLDVTVSVDGDDVVREGIVLL